MAIDREYVQDDDWRVEDANAQPTESERATDLWLARHRPDGTHLPPAAQAAARVAFVGGKYVLASSDGIASVVGLSTGRVQITLSFPMVGPESWIAVVTPTGAEMCGAHELASNKSQTVAEAQITNRLGTPSDSEFFLTVYGDRL